MEAKMAGLMKEYENLGSIGIVGEYIYRMDNNPNEFYMAVVFESEEAYKRNAGSPEQDARYRKFRELLAADPEWHDGTIVYSHIESAVR